MICLVQELAALVGPQFCKQEKKKYLKKFEFFFFLMNDEDEFIYLKIDS